MDQEECYAWGEIFASDRAVMVKHMSARASALGMTLEERGDALVWGRDGVEDCRWVIVDDPSDIERVRTVFNSDENAASPRCFVVVTQRDESDTRGEIIFDIFEMSPRSYLSHFYRVYTRPAGTTRS